VLVQFSEGMRQQSITLKSFLLQQLYRHPRVVHTTDQAKQVVHKLFEIYMSRPAELPQRYQTRVPGKLAGAVANELAPVVADYIAGMTDRFALREHYRLTGEMLLSEDL
jgi:dGTPase